MSVLIKPSELLLEDFNSCPGQRFKDKLDEQEVEYEFVNIKLAKETWKNDTDTAVVHIKSKNHIDYIHLLSETNLADEIEYQPTEEGVVLRFWWD